jgi:hypothetical protein
LEVHRSKMITYLGSLQAHDVNEIFSGNMQDTAIFRNHGFRALV